MSPARRFPSAEGSEAPVPPQPSPAQPRLAGTAVHAVPADIMLLLADVTELWAFSVLTSGGSAQGTKRFLLVSLGLSLSLSLCWSNWDKSAFNLRWLKPEPNRCTESNFFFPLKSIRLYFWSLCWFRWRCCHTSSKWTGFFRDVAGGLFVKSLSVVHFIKKPDGTTAMQSVARQPLFQQPCDLH